MTPAQQLRYWALGLAVFLALLYVLRGILAPFVIGMAVAYLLDPVCDWLERRGLSRTLATTAVTIVFILVVAAALLLLVPLVVSQAASLLENVPAYVDLLRQQLLAWFETFRAQIDPELLTRLRDSLAGSAEKLSGWILGVMGQVVSGGFALFNLLSLLLITPIVAFYLLRDWDKLIAKADDLLPPAYADTIRTQVGEVDRILSGFVRGVASVCLLLGAFYAVGLSVVGLDFGLVIGLVAGLISFVPFLGAIVGFVVSVGLALLQFDSWLLILAVAAIFMVGQALEGNVLTPKLVGGRVGLHPVWVIFGLLAGGAMFGFVGVLLAVPAAAVIGVGVRFAVQQYRAEAAGGGEARP